MHPPKTAILTASAIALIVATIAIGHRSTASDGQSSQAQGNGGCHSGQPSHEEIKRLEDSMDPQSNVTFASVLTAERDLVDLFVRPLEPLPLLQAALAGTEDYAVKREFTFAPDFGSELARAPTVAEAEAEFATAFQRLTRQTAGRLESRELVYAAITAMTTSLHDPHTGYLSPNPSLQYELLPPLLDFVGIQTDDGILIEDIKPGGSADAAGLQPGDVILTDNPLVETATNGYSLAVLRGGQEIALTAKYKFSEPGRLFRYALLEGTIGYVRVYGFPLGYSCESLHAFEQNLDDALRELGQQGAEAWILDLRGNGGGGVVPASYVAGRFGYQGIFATLSDRSGHRRETNTSVSALIGGPLEILVDRNSASASEVVAYTFQGSGLGTIVGSRTAGAVVGAGTKLLNAGMLEIGEFVVEAGPSHAKLDGVGVGPDLNVALDLDLLMHNGRDTQLEAALADIRSRQGDHK